MKLKVPKTKEFSILDWGIHIGVAMNVIVALVIVWYVFIG